MDSEKELIGKVKKKDSDALKKLCARYQPMINGVKQRYYLRDYDYDDWQQEALIVCYETTLLWEPEKKNFAGFFKMRMYNHAKNLVRYQGAKRRAAFNHSSSYEMMVQSGSLHEKSENMLDVPLSEYLDKLEKRISHLEKLALLEALGLLDKEEIIKTVSKLSLARAKSRLQRKIKDLLR